RCGAPDFQQCLVGQAARLPSVLVASEPLALRTEQSMKHPDDTLVTPIYVKSDAAMPWPEDDKVFHVLTGSGLYLCRNHPFFRSCVPAPSWPSELAPQESFLDLHYPKIPRRRFEVVVGFFARIAELHGSEAAVLMVWDAPAKRLRLIAPEQVATVS